MSYQSSAVEQHGAALPEPLRAGVDPFIAQTYVWFFVAMAAMAAVGTASFFFVPRQWLAGLSTADGILWALCGWLGWRQPLALVFPLFCLVTGLMLGPLVHLLLGRSIGRGGADADRVRRAVGLRPSERAGFFVSGRRALRGVFPVGGRVGATRVRAAAVPAHPSGKTILGVAAFGGWVLYDTGQILERADDDLTPGRAAFELFLDLVGFNGWLLDFLDLWKSPDRDGDA